MKLDRIIKERPVAAGVTIASVLGGVVVLLNFMPAMELMVSIKNSPQVASAALQKAEVAEKKADESREWIDTWIAEQQRQREFDTAMREKELEYQRQMLELQQRLQSQANTPQRPTIQPLVTFVGIDADGTQWCCEARTEEACWTPDDEGRNGWRRCE